jgi:hypothetical protein
LTPAQSEFVVSLPKGKREFHENAFDFTAVCFLTGYLSSSFATTYTSVSDGDWANVAFGAANNPDSGDYTVNPEGVDSVIIDGHTVAVNGDTYGGQDGDPVNDRFTVSNGNSVTIRGGGSLTFSDSAVNQHAWVGRRGNGTINIESGSLIASGVQQLRIGSAGAGTVTVGDGIGPAGDATIDMGGQLIFVRQAGNLGIGGAHLQINSDGQVLDARFTVGQNRVGSVTIDGGFFQSAINQHYVGQNNGGIGTFTMNNDALFELTSFADGAFRVGGGGTSTGTLTLNDNAAFDMTATGGRFHIARDGTSTGVVNLNDSSSIIGTRNTGNSDHGIVLGRGGSSATLNINDNSLINITSPITLGSFSTITTDVLRVNQNGGTVITDKDIFVGRFGGNSEYILNSGTVQARDLRLGFEAGTGIFTQNGGTITLTGRDLLMSENTTLTSGSGVYNLLGGTLRVDRINLDAGADDPVDGVFNWGGGTLTMRNPNANNDPGAIDYTTTDPINGIGQTVRSGTTISVTGDMSTTTAGISTLDLGGLHRLRKRPA